MFPLTGTLAHLAVALLLAIEFASADQCYWKANDQARKDGKWFSCGTNTAQKSGGAELCCMTGSECGEDSICRASSNGTAGSEWYVGGCTDSTYNDPACRDDCTSYQQQWIAYNDTRDVWRCCGDYACDETPIYNRETFAAVAPSSWSALPTSGSNSSSSSSGLSKNEKIEIGVGAGVGGLILIGAIVGLVVCLRRRKLPKISSRSSRGKQPYGPSGKYEEIRGAGLPQEGVNLTSYEGARSREPSPAPGIRVQDYRDQPLQSVSQGSGLYAEDGIRGRSPSPGPRARLRSPSPGA